MEEHKRTLLAVAISLLILLAVGYSFGMNIFAKTPDIVLADPDAAPGVTGAPGPSADQGGIRVEVNARTVRSIIADMARYHSYSRAVTVRYSWPGSDDGAALTALVRVDGGWTRCDTMLSSGLTEHSVVGDRKLWYWYGDGKDFLQASAEERTEDLLQHIPTYEDILALEDGDILAAGYEEKDGDPSIFVEAKGSLPGYTERYWVSVRSGLLSAAETVKDGAVVYAMSSGEVVSPLTEAGDAFTLPDGTALHSVNG